MRSITRTAVFLDFNLTIGHSSRRAKRAYKIGRRRQLLRRRSARGEKRLFGQKVTSWQWANPKIQKASTATHLLGEKDTLELKRQQNHQRVFYPSNDPKKKAVITEERIQDVVSTSIRDMKNYVVQLQLCIVS